MLFATTYYQLLFGCYIMTKYLKCEVSSQFKEQNDYH